MSWGKERGGGKAGKIVVTVTQSTEILSTGKYVIKGRHAFFLLFLLGI